MPDIFGGKVTRWPDELCGSCRRESCSLIDALKELEIESVTGFKVFSCAHYRVNVKSPYIGLQEIRDKAHNMRARNQHALAELDRLVNP